MARWVGEGIGGTGWGRDRLAGEWFGLARPGLARRGVVGCGEVGTGFAGHGAARQSAA